MIVGMVMQRNAARHAGARCPSGWRQPPAHGPRPQGIGRRWGAAWLAGVLLFLGSAMAVPVAATSVAAAPPAMIDAHAHYTAADAQVLPPAEILAKLDAAGVHRIVISGTPPEAAQQLHRHAPDRVLPFLGVYASDFGKAVWMHDAQLPQRVREQLAQGRWVGIGELHLFARDAGSPVFAALVALAVEHDLILMIHGDVAVIDRVFTLAPTARVLWAHLGTFPVPELVDDTLVRHHDRALWIDTSVRDDRIAPDGVLLPEWRTLLERHPERFVVGVDPFSTQRWQRYGEVVATIRRWVSGLPAPLARRLLHDNAAAMLAAR
jgi:hypothetical protein